MYRRIVGVMCLGMVWWSISAQGAQAYVPVFTEQETLHDIEEITDTTTTQVFFGELTGMPHTYEIVSRESFMLSLELRSPHSVAPTPRLSAIVIQVPPKGRVTEVTRLVGEEVQWEGRTDELTRDAYEAGASYTQELEPGTYRIEVHTPDNTEKYMLRVGTTDTMTVGYIELLKRLGAVKEFYGTSRLWLIVTPYVYVPLLLLIGFIAYFFYRRYSERSKMSV